MSAIPGPSTTPGATSVPAPARGMLLWRATRPLYILTSLVPALAGSLVALGADDARWWLLAPALVALALVHAATNACNDVEDAANGVDAPNKINNSGVFNTGLLSLREGRTFYGALFGAAVVLGLAMSAVQGAGLLAIGVAGVLGGWLYTGGPQPYKYAGLGDPLIVLLMGPLLTQGAYAAITGDGFHAAAFWLGVGPGLLIAAVLAANNLADIDDDRAAGVRTLAVRLGFGRARALYLAVLVGGLATPVALWAADLFGPWILLPLLVAPLGLAAVRTGVTVTRGDEDVLVALTPQTAQVHLLSCALLCAAVALDRA